MVLLRNECLLLVEQISSAGSAAVVSVGASHGRMEGMAWVILIHFQEIIVFLDCHGI
jgi:hypothetical protein